jgi:hypothetical protein
MQVRVDHLLDAAVQAGLVRPRAVRSSGWISGQHCPAGCDGGARRKAACSYAADGGRFVCHRCGLKGDFGTWLVARGETPDRYASAPPAPVPPPRSAVLDVPAAWAGLQARPGLWRATVARWASEQRRWPADLVAALVGQGLHPPLDDVGAFFTGRMPGPTALLLERARRLERPILLALRDAEGTVRSAHLRPAGLPPEGAPKTLALPQWLTGPSSSWGGLTLFGRLEAAVQAAQQQRTILLVEGGPDYLVAAALVRLGFAGAALGAPSCGELAGLARALGARLQHHGITAEIGMVPHRGDVDDAGIRSMVAARATLGPLARAFWVPVAVDAEGKGDLASTAAQVQSARVLAALLAPRAGQSARPITSSGRAPRSLPYPEAGPLRRSRAGGPQ